MIKIKDHTTSKVRLFILLVIPFLIFYPHFLLSLFCMYVFFFFLILFVAWYLFAVWFNNRNFKLSCLITNISVSIFSAAFLRTHSSSGHWDQPAEPLDLTVIYCRNWSLRPVLRTCCLTRAIPFISWERLGGIERSEAGKTLAEGWVCRHLLEERPVIRLVSPLGCLAQLFESLVRHINCTLQWC